MLSISSMKMMLGACSRAITNSSRTILLPSPMNFWTSSEPDTLQKHSDDPRHAELTQHYLMKVHSV